MSELTSLCACLGPGNGEPYCPCVMRQKGLKTTAYEWTEEDKARLDKALKEMCEPAIASPGSGRGREG